MEDQFEKRNKEKKERVAKNELQRLSNISRHAKGKGRLRDSDGVNMSHWDIC